MNRIYLYFFIGIIFCDTKAELNNFITANRNTVITNAIELASHSVVGINVTQIKNKSFDPFSDPFFNQFFDPFYRNKRKSYTVKSVGSGIIVDSSGYIVTNSHVVENASEIIVSYSNGENYDAVIVGVDELTDVALLKIEANDKLPNLKKGDSNNLIVGEWVVALGNPLGLFDISKKPTATIGIISGVGLDFGQKESGKVYQNMLQTDASINPGNSGGPLINVMGEVIGMNTFIMTNSNYNEGSIGIGFAIPVNTVLTIVSELKKYGKIERNFITGLHVQKLDENMKNFLKIGNKTGVIITNIDVGSSGEKAGLNAGDVIVSINNININSLQDILKVINEGLYRTGDFIELQVYRDEKIVNFELELQKNNKNEVSY